jgi:hypothetical protein
MPISNVIQPVNVNTGYHPVLPTSMSLPGAECQPVLQDVMRLPGRYGTALAVRVVAFFQKCGEMVWAVVTRTTIVITTSALKVNVRSWCRLSSVRLYGRLIDAESLR